MKDSAKHLIKRLLNACLREQLLKCSIQGDTAFIPLPRSRQLLLAKKVQQFHLGKLKFQDDIILISQDKFSIVETTQDLLKLIHIELQEQINPSDWEQFIKEIDNCTLNSALTKRFTTLFNQSLKKEITKTNAPDFVDYLNYHLTTEQQLRFFERWAAQGHPYHPCHKTKLGFNVKAYLKFSPEFHQDIPIPLVALHKEETHVEEEASLLNYNAWFESQFPDILKAFKARLESMNLSSTDYQPIFVHPWQYENVLTKLFANLIEKNRLILFKDITLSTKASLSFRTMIVNESVTLPHIKLPIAVRSTSAMRTITPASIQNSPKLSAILKKIFLREPEIAAVCKIAYESYGLHVKHAQSDIVKHLSILYRQNPAIYVTQQQLPIVVAALLEKSPATALPLYIEILQKAVGKTLEAAKQYFNQYCRITIKAYLDLFLIYGIALEGHQQNTIAVFENHYPVFMITRDLGGLRIHTPSLSAQGFQFVAHAESAIVSENPQEVTNKFLHATIQYHLGELVLLLAEHYHTEENEFWDIIKQNLEKRFAELKNKVDAERFQQEYNSILIDDWQFKALMRMRLNNVYSNYLYINFKNPLTEMTTHD